MVTGNRLADTLIRDLGGAAAALRYARRIAAQNGPLADEYHTAGNAIAATVDAERRANASA